MYTDEYSSQSDSDSLEPLAPLDVEVWFDYHSEELVTLWHALKDKVAELGVYVLDECTIHEFVKFCYDGSSGRIPPA